MADINVAFFKKSIRANAYGSFIASENVTSLSTSKQTAAAATECFARVKAVGGDVFVLSGDNPTATTSGVRLSDGETIDLAVMAGWKIAGINAA